MFRAYCLVKGLLKAIRDASRILHSLLYVNADIKTFNSNSFSPPVACKFFDGSELPVVYRERVREMFLKALRFSDKMTNQQTPSFFLFLEKVFGINIISLFASFLVELAYRITFTVRETNQESCLRKFLFNNCNFFLYVWCNSHRSVKVSVDCIPFVYFGTFEFQWFGNLLWLR